MSEQPVILATATELLRAATGNPIVVSILNGPDVLLRLPTAEEFRRMNAEARESLIAHGLEAPDPPHDSQIERIVAPLRIP